MTKKRIIDVRKQKNLSIAGTFRLCMKGVMHRLLRSVLTLAVVVLAVAFFMFLLAENIFLASVGRGVWREAAECRFAAHTLSRIFNVPSDLAMARRLSDSWNGVSGMDLNQFATVTGWNRQRVSELAESCAMERVCIRFFDEMSPGKKIVMVERRRGRNIFRFLLEQNARAEFFLRLQQMPDLRLPVTREDFSAFIDGFESYEKELSAFSVDWRESIRNMNSAIERLTGDQPLETWLTSCSPEELNAWRGLVVDTGFVLSESQARRLQDQLKWEALRQDVIKQLGTADKRARWQKVFKENKKISIDKKLQQLNDRRVVEILDDKYDLATLCTISEMARHEGSISEMERKLSGKIEKGSDGSLSGRQLFLLFISFVVCMVGIANAMLMSITERFREIATMKCLGATDKYILAQFMMEAALQGLVGGVLGMLIGLLISSIKSALEFGSFFLSYWPEHGLGLSCLASVIVGVMLATMASIYPSWSASRMAPMEAMRVE